MQPTMKLRYVKRIQQLDSNTLGLMGCTYLVLQQWHEQTVSIPIDGVVTEQVVGEWIDVPIEVES